MLRALFWSAGGLIYSLYHHCQFLSLQAFLVDGANGRKRIDLSTEYEIAHCSSPPDFPHHHSPIYNQSSVKNHSAYSKSVFDGTRKLGELGKTFQSWSWLHPYNYISPLVIRGQTSKYARHIFRQAWVSINDKFRSYASHLKQEWDESEGAKNILVLLCYLRSSHDVTRHLDERQIWWKFHSELTFDDPGDIIESVYDSGHVAWRDNASQPPQSNTFNPEFDDMMLR